MRQLPDEILTIVHSMLYILKKLGGRSDFHKIFKTLYFADQKHLVKYGSPVIYDRYIAMRNGPVPSSAYDIIKSLKGQTLWPVPKDEFSKYFRPIGSYKVEALLDPDMDYLSQSEVEALDESIDENQKLNFGDLTNKSHDEAWGKANKNDDIDIIEMARSGRADEDMVYYIKTHLENRNARCL